MNDNLPAPVANILVATDFSSAGAAAVARASLLPLAKGATVTVLHVLPPELPERLSVAMTHAAERRLRGLVDTIAARLHAAGKDAVKVAARVEAGHPVEVICRQAQLLRADLLIVGRTGLGRTKARPLGSTSERVARASEMSVLIVATEPRGSYSRPLVGIDGSPLTAAVIEMALRVTAPDVRAVDVVHGFAAPGVELLRDLDSDNREIEDYVAKFAAHERAQLEPMLASLPRYGVALRPVFVEGDARWVLLREADKHEADLIVVGSRGHGRLLHLLLGNVAEAIVREATSDVLVVR